MKRNAMIPIAVVLLTLFVFSEPISAYIDPATTTYVIQIVSALIITLGVTIGVFFTRLRMSLINGYVRISAFLVRLISRKKRGEDARDQLFKAEQKKASADAKVIARPFKKRLQIALPVAASAAFTFLLFGPYELYMLNTDSFPFPFGQIAWLLLLFTVLVTAAVTGILLLLPGRAFESPVSVLFGILLAGYVQGNFLNRSLGQLTGDEIVWDTRGGEFLLNTLIWAFLIALPFLIRRFSLKAWASILKGVSALLILVQLVSMVALYEPSPPAEQEMVLTTNGMYELASENNIVVIVLDRLDNRYIESVLKKEPAFFDRLDGFTRFTNNVSLYSQTFPSVVNMFTGRIYDYGESKKQFMKDAWTTSDFIPGLREDGFGTSFYMEKGYTFANGEDLAEVADNLMPGEMRARPFEAIGQFLRLSALRSGPMGAKPFLWTTTETFSQLVKTDAAIPPYVTDDIRYYNQLKRQKLSTADRAKQFSYLHLRGPHAPYVMNEKAEKVSKDKTNSTIQTEGSFHILYEYLDQLKALGLYKDSTIVITGDHGSRKDDREPLDRAIVTGLFVKPAGSEGLPLAINRAPVSSDNLRPFIYEAAGLPHEGLGLTYFEVPENSRGTRYLYHYLMASEGRPERLLTYEIKGDANIFANWTLTETETLD